MFRRIFVKAVNGLSASAARVSMRSQVARIQAPLTRPDAR
jgi:hypothetical protein